MNRLTAVGTTIFAGLMCGTLMCGALFAESPKVVEKTEGNKEVAEAAAAVAYEAKSAFGRELMARRSPDDLSKLEKDLAEARAAYAASPDDPDKLIWVGRRLGYLWRMREAIAVYTKGIEKWPDNAAMYRHRGHRYVSIREYHMAIEDLRRAADLIRGKPHEIEQDGMPNAKNIPLTTTGFNIYYHLGLAYYYTSQFDQCILTFRQALAHARGKHDNLVACIDWMWMAHQSLGEQLKAEKILQAVNKDMEIIENQAYFKRTRLYKGELTPEDVLKPGGDELQTVTAGYGVAKWYLVNGQEEKAKVILRKLIHAKYWPAFGVAAAEAEWESRKSAWGEP